MADYTVVVFSLVSFFENRFELKGNLIIFLLSLSAIKQLGIVVFKQIFSNRNYFYICGLHSATDERTSGSLVSFFSSSRVVYAGLSQNKPQCVCSWSPSATAWLGDVFLIVFGQQ